MLKLGGNCSTKIKDTNSFADYVANLRSDARAPLVAIVFNVPNNDLAVVCRQVAVLLGTGALPWVSPWEVFYIQCPSPAA